MINYIVVAVFWGHFVPFQNHIWSFSRYCALSVSICIHSVSTLNPSSIQIFAQIVLNTPLTRNLINFGGVFCVFWGLFSWLLSMVHGWFLCWVVSSCWCMVQGNNAFVSPLARALLFFNNDNVPLDSSNRFSNPGHLLSTAIVCPL